MIALELSRDKVDKIGINIIELHVALDNANKENLTLNNENEKLKKEINKEKVLRADNIVFLNQKQAEIEKLMNENEQLRKSKADYIERIKELTVQIEDMTTALLEDTDKEGYHAAMTLLYKVMNESRKGPY